LARRQLSEANGISPFDKVEREALLDEISRLPRGVYEPVRRSVAKLLNWRAGALDDDRKQRRGRPQSDADDEAAKAGHIEPWPDPVLDLASVLELAVQQMRRFLIVPSPSYLDAAALWCAHSYLLRNEAFGVTFTSLLAFQSPLKRCGKSTALKCVHLMSCNAHLISSISASSLFRIIDEFGVSLMLDEADNVFRDEKSDLLAVFNAGRDRLTARVMRVESLGDGKFKVREFNTFTAVALSSIKALPATLQDRAIVLSLKRATHGERPERLTLTERGPLIDVGRRLARWAADLPAQSLPRPAPTGLHNRIEDSWFVLFQVAELAGGDWPERCRKAAHADLVRQETNDADGGRDADLLADVWTVFREQNRLRLFTEDLCNALNSLEESPWRLANGGKPVDGYFLKRHLTDFLPNDSESLEPRKWREGAVQARGYHERHFEDAFVRYLGRQLPSKTQNDNTNPPDRESYASAYRSKNASHPSHSPQESDSHSKSETYGVTDNGVPASTGHPHPSQNTVRDPAAEGASKDQSKAEHQQNEGSRGAAVGDERVGGPMMEPVQHGPSGGKDFSGHSNDGMLIDFPRGVSVRRRRPPGAEV
jgi:hypothetical protein